MGSWFSNLHIRKKEGISTEQITESLTRILEKEGCELAPSAEGSDYGLAVLSSSQSEWFSIHSDIFAFEDPAKFLKFGKPCSEMLCTDILGICCTDSDYLYLNLLNTQEGVDAWASIGSGKDMGILRRSSARQWKQKVEDHAAFQQLLSRKYVCAEEFLCEAEACLKLPSRHSNLDYGALNQLDLPEQATYLFFKLPEQEQTELPKLQIHTYSLMPCEMGKAEVVSCINTSGRGRGLSVYFVGDYVQKDEIIFENVQWQIQKKDAWEYRPIVLEKVRLADGKWAFRGHDPDLPIPPAVKPGLHYKKKMEQEFERAIHVRFTPKGNGRKRLDIAVVFVPDGNPAGQAGWLVWAHFPSKREYIREHNTRWKKLDPKLVIPEASVDGL